MNERIKELAAQADEYATEKAQDGFSNYNLVYDRKFAELIVKECAGLVVNDEIKEGDMIMIASKNEVRRVKVVKIAKKPFIASYGIVNRKLTVRDEVEDQTLTINDPRATVKVI